MNPPPGSTRYRDRPADWGARFLFGLAFLGWFSVGASRGKSAAVHVLILTLLAAAIGGAVFCLRRVGTVVSSEGIWLGRVFSWRFIPLEEIRSFRPSPTGLYPRVLVELTSGRLVGGTGLVQGRKMYGNGNQGRDIASVLNAELEKQKGG